MKKYFLIVLALALSGCTPLWEANRYGRYKFYEGIEEGAKKGFIEGYKKQTRRRSSIFYRNQ
jgi:hypothetical protein